MKKGSLFSFLAIISLFLFCFGMGCPYFNVEGVVDACFTVEPKTGTLATDFVFSAECTTYEDVDCHIPEFYWSFGDGTTAHTKNRTITHTYSSEGYYMVSLDSIICTTNPEGTKSAYIDYVTVVKPNNCDEHMIEDTTWAITEIDLTSHRSYDYNQDSVSYGFFQPTIENICATEHILVGIGYTLEATVVNQVKIVSDVTYAILYEYPFNNFEFMGDNNYLQVASIGLHHIYGDGPGWLFVW